MLGCVGRTESELDTSEISPPQNIVKADRPAERPGALWLFPRGLQSFKTAPLSWHQITDIFFLFHHS